MTYLLDLYQYEEFKGAPLANMNYATRLHDPTTASFYFDSQGKSYGSEWIGKVLNSFGLRRALGGP